MSRRPCLPALYIRGQGELAGRPAGEGCACVFPAFVFADFGVGLAACACRFELRYFDPFLVLDEFSGELSIPPLSEWASLACPIPVELIDWLSEFRAVSAPAGFPDHPHRGFETVTYMLEVRSQIHFHRPFPLEQT